MFPFLKNMGVVVAGLHQNMAVVVPRAPLLLFLEITTGAKTSDAAAALHLSLHLQRRCD